MRWLLLQLGPLSASLAMLQNCNGSSSVPACDLRCRSPGDCKGCPLYSKSCPM